MSVIGSSGGAPDDPITDTHTLARVTPNEHDPFSHYVQIHFGGEFVVVLLGVVALGGEGGNKKPVTLEIAVVCAQP